MTIAIIGVKEGKRDIVKSASELVPSITLCDKEATSLVQEPAISQFQKKKKWTKLVKDPHITGSAVATLHGSKRSMEDS